jgi:hypothetical protein
MKIEVAVFTIQEGRAAMLCKRMCPLGKLLNQGPCSHCTRNLGAVYAMLAYKFHVQHSHSCVTIVKLLQFFLVLAQNSQHSVDVLTCKTWDTGICPKQGFDHCSTGEGAATSRSVLTTVRREITCVASVFDSNNDPWTYNEELVSINTLPDGVVPTHCRHPRTSSCTRCPIYENQHFRHYRDCLYLMYSHARSSRPMYVRGKSRPVL